MNRITIHCIRHFSRLITLFLTLSLSAGLNADPQETEVPMPGPWGDDFSETMVNPEQVADIEAAQGFRQQQMQMLSAYYRSLEQALRYNADHHDELKNLASAFAHRAEQLPDWFRERSPAQSGEPGALELVWEAPKRFRQHLDQFSKRTGNLAERIELSTNAAEDEAVLRDLNQVRHQCLACHQEFRRR